MTATVYVNGRYPLTYREVFQVANAVAWVTNALGLSYGQVEYLRDCLIPTWSSQYGFVDPGGEEWCRIGGTITEAQRKNPSSELTENRKKALKLHKDFQKRAEQGKVPIGVDLWLTRMERDRTTRLSSSDPILWQHPAVCFIEATLTIANFQVSDHIFPPPTSQVHGGPMSWLAASWPSLQIWEKNRIHKCPSWWDALSVPTTVEDWQRLIGTFYENRSMVEMAHAWCPGFSDWLKSRQPAQSQRPQPPTAQTTTPGVSSEWVDDLIRQMASNSKRMIDEHKSQTPKWWW